MRIIKNKTAARTHQESGMLSRLTTISHNLAVLVIGSSLLATTPALAQTTGVIQGIVQDPGERLVPNARVTAIQQGTNVARNTVSDAEGHYTFPAVPVGNYRLQIDAKGFENMSTPESRFA